MIMGSFGRIATISAMIMGLPTPQGGRGRDV